MKKFVLVLLVMVLFGQMPALAESNVLEEFPDVYRNQHDVQAIKYVYNQGIVKGYPNGQFVPEAFVNRAELVKMVIAGKYDLREIAKCDLQRDMKFLDVPKSEWYAKYICFAYQKGIISGEHNGQYFRPESRVSFVEAAKIIALTYSGQKLIEGSPWYDDYVKFLSDKNAIPLTIARLDNDTYYGLNREEIAQIIYRVMASSNQPSFEYEEVGDLNLIYKFIGGNKYSKSLYNFKKLSKHHYSFDAVIYGKDLTEVYFKNYELEILKGEVKILSEKLETNFVQRQTIFDQNKIISLEFDIDREKAFLIENEKKTLLEASNPLIYEPSKSYSNAIFSEDGNYAALKIRGYESPDVDILDLKTGKKLEFVATNFGFSKTGKVFFVCSNIFDGAMTKVNLADMEEEPISLDADRIEQCGPYNSVNNTFRYTFSLKDLFFAVELPLE